MTFTLSRPVIIIADKERANRLLIKELLASENVDTREAATGEETIELAKKTKNVALVLLDLYMEDMDGFDLSLTLRSSEATVHIPIIFQTTKPSNSNTVLRAYYAGAVDHIQKPIDPDIILAKMRIFI